ncbi:MFS transporter [Morganella psychrotolerans]|uniref:Major facilitator superfamily (MFS) profile domain-containing protein n=1 Tax=Morganella psychrotolerans TaxID=368603 RepID=A0A1B8HSN7_9GAMM|nr:MFS transporter [Morganella psychrotolerans]OBU12728.1 hypothetical protein AYY18_14750 [Morganella psychrotolerans]
MEKNHNVKQYPMALALPVFMASMNSSIVNVAVPSLIEAFDTPFSNIQWVIVVYLISLTSAAVVTGQVGDRIDRRKVLCTAVFLFTLASALCGLAPTVLWLIAGRVLQGIAAAMMMNSTMALIAGMRTGQSGGKTMGWIGALSAMGTAAGPACGGWLTGQWGWPAVFFINVPAGIAALFFIIRFVKPQPVSSVQRLPVNRTGILLLTLIIAMYSSGMIINDGMWRLLLLAAACGGVLLFLQTERRTTNPVFPVALIKQPALITGMTLSILVSTVMMALLVAGPFWLMHQLHLSPLQAGLMMSCGPLVAAFTGIPAGKLTDKIGADKVVVYALVMMTVGFSLFTLLGVVPRAVLYLIFIAIITSGYAAFQAANNSAILFRIDSQEKGLLAGLINLSRNTGLINGATLMGTLFSVSAGSISPGNVAEENIGRGFILTFGVATCLMLISTGIALRYLRRR